MSLRQRRAHGPGLGCKLVDEGDGFSHALLVAAPQFHPGHGTGRKSPAEGLLHVVADVLAIAQSVLDEGDLVPGEQIEIRATGSGQSLHAGGTTAHIPLMP